MVEVYEKCEYELNGVVCEGSGRCEATFRSLQEAEEWLRWKNAGTDRYYIHTRLPVSEDTNILEYLHKLPEEYSLKIDCYIEKSWNPEAEPPELVPECCYSGTVGAYESYAEEHNMSQQFSQIIGDFETVTIDIKAKSCYMKIIELDVK